MKQEATTLQDLTREHAQKLHSRLMARFLAAQTMSDGLTWMVRQNPAWQRQLPLNVQMAQQMLPLIPPLRVP